MKIRENIEKQLIRDIQYALDELDVDGMVERLVKSKKVNEAVERMVQEKIAEIIQEKAFTKIKKAMPIIDVWTDQKVKAFLYELGVK